MERGILLEREMGTDAIVIVSVGPGDLAKTLRAEYGEEARLRRQRAGHRARVDKMLSPAAAALVGPERLPAAAFDQTTIDALLAP
jgi:hypothetical protein